MHCKESAINPMAMRTLFATIILLSSLNASAQKLNEKYVDTYLSSIKEVKVEDNDMVGFRIEKEIQLNDGVIPRNTFFYATARFTDGRMHFNIDKIKVEDDVYAVNLTLVGADLKEGLPCYKKKPTIILPSGGPYRFLIKDGQN